MKIEEELTLKKIQIFLAFMRHGNLSKTADEMQISNVSVHKALHSLESSLGCPLFKNEGRNLIPPEKCLRLTGAFATTGPGPAQCCQ